MKSATRILISTFGGYTGLMGIEHGIGEILQGNVAPKGIMILSWPESAFFRILSGEPAMTILPNLLATGVLATLFSLAFIGWAVFFVERKHSGKVMALLAILMLLFGGGMFPPVFGLLIAAAAARIHAPLTGRQKHLSPRLRAFLSRLWPWFFSASLLSWLAMIPGVPVLSTVFGVENELLIFGILACMFGFLFLSALAGYARDIETRAHTAGEDSRFVLASRSQPDYY